MSRISSFPDFTHITIDLQDEIVNFTQKFDLYADFSFINLFSWNTDGVAGACWLNNNLVIRIPDYVFGGEHLYSILGVNKIDASLESLFERVNRLDLVPEIVVTSLEAPEHYAIAEDRDSFDYLYNIGGLCELSGSKLKNKRQKVAQTLKLFGNRISFDNTSKLSKKLREEMTDVLKRWQLQTPQPAQHTRLEEIALNRLFDNFDHFRLNITTVRVDGRLEGFSIHEVINNKESICHFEKSITKEHDGMYAVLINEAAKSIRSESQIVNWEQDLGIPGLKHIKKSYAPIRYRKKYWIHNGKGSF